MIKYEQQIGKHILRESQKLKIDGFFKVFFKKLFQML
jgi:hypothetical protein